jgi:hypothetical protein
MPAREVGINGRLSLCAGGVIVESSDVADGLNEQGYGGGGTG